MSDNDIICSQQPIIEGGQILWVAIPGSNSSQPPPGRLLRFPNTEDYSNRRPPSRLTIYQPLSAVQWLENNAPEQEYHTFVLNHRWFTSCYRSDTFVHSVCVSLNWHQSVKMLCTVEGHNQWIFGGICLILEVGPADTSCSARLYLFASKLLRFKRIIRAGTICTPGIQKTKHIVTS